MTQKRTRTKTLDAETRANSVADRRAVWTCAAILVAMGTLAYSSSFQGVFLYDDLLSIRNNELIRSLWPLSSAMSLPLHGSGLTVDGRPILSLSFALNYYFLGQDPAGFHAVNLAIHLLAGLTLFGIIRRSLTAPCLRKPDERQSSWIALAVSLLWLVHPLQTESVTYIVQRAESLVGLFYLLTLYCAIRGLRSDRPTIWHTLAVLSCLLGMGTKEVMATAPLVVLAYDRTFDSGSFRASISRRPAFYAGLAAAWLVLTYPLSGLLTDSGDDIRQAGNAMAYAATQPEVLLYYLRLAVWPSPLVVHYGWPLAGSFAAVLPYGLGILALLAVVLRQFWRRSWVGFAGVYFFLILAPTSSFVALGQRIQEHRMYLPLAAVLLLAVAAARQVLAYLTHGRTTVRQYFGTSLLVSATVTMAWLTYTRNQDYRDDVVFWADAVGKRPQSSSAANNLALALEQRGYFAEARRHYEKAAALDPTNAEAYNNLGVLLQRQGEWSPAAAVFRRAIDLRPNLPHAHFNLGRLSEREGDLQGARLSYERTIQLSPKFALAHNNLGVVYERSGELAKARAAYDRAIALLPDYAEAHNNLGSLLFRQGEFARAEAQFSRALSIRPELAVARDNLQKVRGRLRSIDRSETEK